jgi:hypothetical protein
VRRSIFLGSKSEHWLPQLAQFVTPGYIHDWWKTVSWWVCSAWKKDGVVLLAVSSSLDDRIAFHMGRCAMACSFRRYGWLIPVLAFSCVVNSEEAKQPAKPSQGSAGKPQLLVTISKATTYITEPLRADGYPDYVAALNQRASRGVTPENNAEVLLCKAIGPNGIDAKLPGGYCSLLNIPALPEKGDYFIRSDHWIAQLKTKANTPSDDAEFENRLYEQQRQVMERPWSKEDFPAWAEWLVANEKPLALVVEASRRPKCFAPIVSDNKALWEAPLPGVMARRKLARALVARAMFRTKAGKVTEAWDDVLACYRLGHLTARGPTMVEMLVGSVIQGLAWNAGQLIGHQPQATAAQTAAMQADLERLSPSLDMADKLNSCERFMAIDEVINIAREGPTRLQKILRLNGESSGMSSILTPAVLAAVDWNVVLQEVNLGYDRAVNAFREPTAGARKAAAQEIKKESDRERATMKEPASWQRNPSRQFGKMIVAQFLPATVACGVCEDRSIMQFELTKLSFVLAAYHKEHGSYPEELADLTPKYIAKVPKDLFNDQELHYRRTSEGFLLYSVGSDGNDDGGKLGVDIIVRFSSDSTPNVNSK